jgi:FAD/FMN-containing dehydrogenase
VSLPSPLKRASAPAVGAGETPVDGAAYQEWAAYDDRVAVLKRQYAAIPPGAAVRLAKKTSNLFRTRAATDQPGLDVKAFDGVIAVDPVARTADVQGMTTYEHLVDATLPYGLMPLVVPQLKTITLGGAVTGLGIESSSFRNGCPHESVLEMDVLTGAGEVVTARPDNEHSDLFFGFPNSYGSLGYALRLKIELQPVEPHVRLRHLRFASVGAAVPVLEQVCRERSWEGEPVDFVDGAVFGPDEVYLVLADWATEAPYTSDYTLEHVYYRSLQQRSEDYLTVRDYLWRWDTDWFWCSRVFGVQTRPRLRKLLGHRYLRSDTWWKLVNLEKKYGFKAKLDARKGLPPREDVVQDIEVPIERLEEFCTDFLREVPIEPFWLCPLQQRDPDRQWPLYRLDPAQLYVNVGFWSTVPQRPGDPDWHNVWVEQEVERLGGRKSLYSTAFYDEPTFWRLYGGDAYTGLKKRYDPDARLADLYAKTVGRR